jgi:hypothetical protein
MMSYTRPHHYRTARRLEWPENGEYLVMHEEKVMLFKPEDNKLHPLIVSKGDILGTDWVII